MKRYLVLPVIALILCACGAQIHAFKPEDLINHRYVLSEVNGVPFVAEPMPVLAFAGDMHISGAFCNNFAGKAEFKGSIILAKNLVSTRKWCFDDKLNALESSFMHMLGTGMEVALSGETLTLRQGEHSFTYRRL